MLWLSWRQHRLQLLIATLVMLTVAIVIIESGLTVRASFKEAGLDECLLQPLIAGSKCAQSIQDFEGNYLRYSPLIPWLNLLPVLLGIFIAAPLVASEVERGTHYLVWTQGVTRSRWLIIKLGLLIVATILFALILTLLVSWWRNPFDRLGIDPAGSSFTPGIAFDLEGLAPLTYSLYALILGVAVGTFFGKTVVAMALTLVGFAVPRLLILNSIRPHLLQPLVNTYMAWQPNPRAYKGDWVLNEMLLDAQNKPILSRLQLIQLCGDPGQGEKYTACLQSHGLHIQELYYSGDSFWLFQSIETLIYLVLILMLAGLTWWWLHKRVK